MVTLKLYKNVINISTYLGILLLWLGITAFDFAPAVPQSLEFLSVVISPFSSADYGVDKFTQDFAPLDMDIIEDAQDDRAQTIILAAASTQIKDNQVGEDGEDDNNDGTNLPVGTPTPTNPAPTNQAPTNPPPTNAPTTNPAPTNPAPTNPAPTNPAPTNPAPTNPAPTDPAPTNPAPTDPPPTNPPPTDPPPTDPAPTDPAPTNPAPTEPPGPPDNPGNGNGNGPPDNPGNGNGPPDNPGPPDKPDKDKNK